MCSDKQVTIKFQFLRSYYYEMNNNWRSELTGRLFLYFVQIATVRIEILEIGYEQKLHEGRPYLAQPLLPSCQFFVTIWSNPPSVSEKDVLFEWPLKFTVLHNNISRKNKYRKKFDHRVLPLR